MLEPNYIEKAASFDDAGIYRYNLLRRWTPGPTVLWIMLNPSTADAVKLDTTLLRCLHFSMTWRYEDSMEAAKRSGERRFAIGHLVSYGAFEVCNLYAFRASKPSVMWAATDPVGPSNDAAIKAAIARASLVIVGWGEGAEPARERVIAQILFDAGVQPYMLRATSSGAPSHPLARGKSRIPDTARPMPWHAKGLRP